MLLNLPETCKFVFFGGKGGVGKSTCASAFATEAADSGRRTLLVSTDPAHNLADIFGVPLSSTASELMTRLSAVEIDPDEEARRYIEAVAAGMRSFVSHEMRPEVDRYLGMAAASPGAVEAAVFERMVSIMLDDAAGYDLVVFDTAPTGHTLRLLSLPESLSTWITALVSRREKVRKEFHAWMNEAEPVSDPLLDILRRRKRRFDEVRAIMVNDRCAIILVLIPEKLPIEETARAARTLSRHGIHVHSLLVNKVLTEKPAEEFYLRRWNQQRVYLRRIDTEFAGYRRHLVPLMSSDISGIEDLKTIYTYT